MQGEGVEGITSSFPAKDHAVEGISVWGIKLSPSKLLNWSTDIYIYVNIYIYIPIMTFNILG